MEPNLKTMDAGAKKQKLNKAVVTTTSNKKKEPKTSILQLASSKADTVMKTNPIMGTIKTRITESVMVIGQRAKKLLTKETAKPKASKPVKKAPKKNTVAKKTQKPK